jgi:hypothetical protein
VGWEFRRCYQNGGVDGQGSRQASVSTRHELCRPSSIDGSTNVRIEPDNNTTEFDARRLLHGLLKRSKTRKAT